MCSNFGMNLHPGRKPCALQWQWYNFFTLPGAGCAGASFPRRCYMYPGRGRVDQPA